MTFLFKEIDFLPPIPQHFVDDALKELSNKGNGPQNSYMKEQLEKGLWFRYVDENGDGKKIRARANVTFLWNNSDFEKWVQENITKNYKNILLSASYPGEENSTTIAPHTDLKRAWNLFYLIKMSNDQQTTCFWQEEGHEIIRPLATYKSDFKNLKKIGEANFKLNTWNAFSTCVLHSVHNVMGNAQSRLAIHISLHEDPTVRPDFFIKT